MVAYESELQPYTFEHALHHFIHVVEDIYVAQQGRWRGPRQRFFDSADRLFQGRHLLFVSTPFP